MTNDPVVKSLPPELLAQYLADAGEGVSTKAADLVFQMARVLQSNSPQVQKRSADYIGGEPGDWWLRGAVDPIRSGTKGIEVVPCGMEHSWVEWMPGRQGFVARYAAMPDVEHRMVKDDSGREKPSLVRRSNGNIIQDSRDYFLLIEGAPYMLPCTSTFHTFAREWNTYFNQIKHPPVTGVVLPSYARRYRLRTIAASNTYGQWFKPKFEDLGWITDPAEYQAAKALNGIVRQGMARIETPAHDGAIEAPARSTQAPGAPGVA